MPYILQNGEYTTYAEIVDAMHTGDARLVHGYLRSGGIITGLMLDGLDFDTRNDCAQMYEAAWTQKPENTHQALMAAWQDE